MKRKISWEEEEEEEEEEVWPPVWKPIELCPEYSLIDFFFDYEEDDFGYPPGVDGHDLFKRFFRQAQQTRGYDVDCIPPKITRLIPMDTERVVGSELVAAQAKFVTREINARAERHGEEYAFDRVEKVVDVSRWYSTYLLTFTVKEVVPNPNAFKTVQAMVVYAGIQASKYCFELRGWRFKPSTDEEEATTTSTHA